ncbi:MAG: hypothetical protein PVG39_08720 [Desulfobacteraceae bacterium]|jgi:transposase
MKTKQVIQENTNTRESVLYMAMELSDKNWKLAFSEGSRERIRTINADKKDNIWKEISESKKRFDLAEDVKVVSCYEAGREGFWIHRYLESHGVNNSVMDPASVEVDRRKRRRKTDRLDAKKLLKTLMRYKKQRGHVLNLE